MKNHEAICTLHTVLHLLFLHFPHKAALILLMANMKKVLLIFQKSTDIPLLLLRRNKGSSTYIIAILTSLGGWCRSSQEKDSLGAVLWGHFVFNSLSPLVTSLRNGSISLTFIKSAWNGRGQSLNCFSNYPFRRHQVTKRSFSKTGFSNHWVVDSFNKKVRLETNYLWDFYVMLCHLLAKAKACFLKIVKLIELQTS